MRTDRLLALALLAALAGAHGARAEPDPVPDFTLKDSAGKEWSLHQQKNKLTVVAFLSCECPMSNAYLRPLADLATKYTDKGVGLVAVNANPEETAEQIRAHAKEYDVRFPILKDDRRLAVRALDAKVNPEVFILDERLVVRYRGRIDNGYSARQKPSAQVTKHDLADAVEALLSGKPVPEPVTRAFGCPIPALERKATGAEAKVTFYRDVLPVLQGHCQSCHRPGNVGPFSLQTYAQALKWAEPIAEEVKGRRMPPWKAERNGLLAHERRLPDKDAATLLAWVEQGLAVGDPKDAPPAPKFPDNAWQLGKPDLVLEANEDVVIDATGRDLFRVVVFPTDLPEDVYVTAVEVLPGNPRVVHHTIQIIDTRGRGRRLQEQAQVKQKPTDRDRGPGYSVFMGVGFFPDPSNGLGGWAPGLKPQPLPEGVGKLLPKGADLVVQLHYHRTGKVERDRTKIGLYFAKGPVKEHLQTIPAPGLFLRIPANDKSFKIDSAIKLTEDVTLHWMVPHMHLLGKDIELTFRLPGTTEEKSLIRIPEWDYNWQEMYALKEPLKLPKGTVLRVRATYDNSADNPLNPNSPPKGVSIGEQTTNEMCFVFLGVSSVKPGWRKFTFASPRDP